jgi:hypothetical protein
MCPAVTASAESADDGSQARDPRESGLGAARAAGTPFGTTELANGGMTLLLRVTLNTARFRENLFGLARTSPHEVVV